MLKHEAHAAIDGAGPDLKWFVIDALLLTQVDIAGIFELEELARSLSARGAELVLAGRMTEIAEWRKTKGRDEGRVVPRHCPPLKEAVRAYRATQVAASADASPL